MRQLLLVVLLSFLPYSWSIAEDSASIEKQYQATFQEGADAYKQRNYSLAEDKFKETIVVNPKGDSLYYYLALSQYNLGKYEEAATNLYKSIDLGYQVPAQIETAMRPYKYREFSVKTPTGHELQFKGATNCSEQLIIDMLPSIVGGSGGSEDNISVIRPKFVSWGDQGKYWQEEWVVEIKNGDNKTFAVTLTPTSDGGANYQVTPK